MKQIEIIVMGGMLNSVIVLLISINSHNKKLQNYLSIYICVICVYCEYAKKKIHREMFKNQRKSRNRHKFTFRSFRLNKH